ncbi:MAG: hypothetical protein ACRDNF_02565 [Streptosporangiaceae bacterium]
MTGQPPPARSVPARLPAGVRPGPGPVIRTAPSRPRRQAVPRTLAARPSSPQRPGDVIRELTTLLRSNGLTGAYYAFAFTSVAVLSVPGLTIWTNGQDLTWTLGGEQTTWAAEDTAGAAAHLATLANPRRRPAAASSTWRSGANNTSQKQPPPPGTHSLPWSGPAA